MQSINPSDPTYIQYLNETSMRATSVNAQDREAAENQIRQLQNSVDTQTGFVGLLLNVAASGMPSSLFCSIVLKNTVKTSWESNAAEHPIQDADKTVLRDNILSVMLQAPRDIQRNIAETISIIAKQDFPHSWPNALTLIIQTLSSAETSIALRSAALSTAHGVLSRYRSETEVSETLVFELRSIYSTLLKPLVGSMNVLVSACEAPTTPSEEAMLACKGLVGSVDCLLDITALELGDELIWGMETIVSIFLRCLTLQNAHLLADRSGTLIELRSVVTTCVTHFLSSFDEDFEKYAGQFLKVVWDMIAAPTAFTAAMDDLAISGMELLSSACRGTTQAAFNTTESVSALIEQVIIPNLALQEEDMDTYFSEPEVYIQKDIEGSDLHTRRRAAGELVRTLVTALPDKANPLLSAKLDALFAQAEANWKAKDTGIFLASSLALHGQRADSIRGAAHQQLSSLIPFESFLRDLVLPELSTPVSAASPAVIKADCIRVVATFRSYIDPQVLARILPLLPTWISNEDPVIFTYAAHALERLLLVQHNQQHLVTEQMFGPHAAAVLQSVCVRVQSSDTPNAYMVQCLMRICQRLPESIAPFIGDIVVAMNVVLGQAARNPSNPLFSHCLFEVLSTCIAQAPQQADAIESTIWDNLIYILANDVLEYVPYALQIIAQLLAAHPRGADAPPVKYQGLLDPLTVPQMYEQRGNIPAVVCLLTTFIERFPQYIISQPNNLTEKILNVFHHLVQLKNHDHEGLNILTVMLLAYPRDVMDRFMTPALQILMNRLQAARTPKYVRILVIFFSIFTVARGAEDLVTRLNSIQPGLFFMFLTRVWLPNVQKIDGLLERKTCLVALTNLLCDSPTMQTNQEACSACLSQCQLMINGGTEVDDYTSFAPKQLTMQDMLNKTLQPAAAAAAGPGGFTNVFCPLKHATREPTDVCAGIADPVQYFNQHLAHRAK